jgi:TPR repeat protein
MMLRAEGLLHNNDVSSGRLLFEHLARSGSARAALAMGKTFDPAFLNTIDAAGLKPDIAKARVWYRQAAELGDQEAAGRLSALASR